MKLDVFTRASELLVVCGCRLCFLSLAFSSSGLFSPEVACCVWLPVFCAAGFLSGPVTGLLVGLTMFREVFLFM